MKKLATLALSLALAASLCIPAFAMTLSTGSSSYPTSVTISEAFTGETSTASVLMYDELDMGDYFSYGDTFEITINYLPANAIFTEVVPYGAYTYNMMYLEPLAQYENGYTEGTYRDVQNGTALADILTAEGSILRLGTGGAAFDYIYIALDDSASSNTTSEAVAEEVTVEEVVEEATVEEVVEEVIEEATVEEVVVEEVTEEITEETSFSDVSEDDAFYDAVLWAVDAGVTTGYADGTFRPETTCTRGQVVTFLYRAMGSPDVTTTENPFSDVSEDSAFYDAILWAVENGITTGYSDGTFRPTDTCTSAQVITFLYRSLGSPEATDFESELAASAAAAYAPAITWADAITLLDGMDFVADDASPRSDIVTYLYLVDGTHEMA